MAEMVTRQELIDAKRDARDLGKAVNEKVIVSPRYGEDFKSLPMISAEFQISSDAAEAAAVSAADSASIAQSSANIAEAAATAATIGAGVFETPEAGVDPITGVADGAYFNVRSSSDESYVDEYQNISGVPTPTGKSYPSRAALNNIPTGKIKDASGKTQQEINAVGGFWQRNPLSAAINSVFSMLDGNVVNIWEFADLADKRDSALPEEWDWSPAISAGIALCKNYSQFKIYANERSASNTLYFPSGKYRHYQQVYVDWSDITYMTGKPTLRMVGENAYISNMLDSEFAWFIKGVHCYIKSFTFTKETLSTNTYHIKLGDENTANTTSVTGYFGDIKFLGQTKGIVLGQAFDIVFDRIYMTGFNTVNSTRACGVEILQHVSDNSNNIVFNRLALETSATKNYTAFKLHGNSTLSNHHNISFFGGHFESVRRGVKLLDIGQSSSIGFYGTIFTENGNNVDWVAGESSLFDATHANNLSFYNCTLQSLGTASEAFNPATMKSMFNVVGASSSVNFKNCHLKTAFSSTSANNLAAFISSDAGEFTYSFEGSTLNDYRNLIGIPLLVFSGLTATNRKHLVYPSEDGLTLNFAYSNVSSAITPTINATLDSLGKFTAKQLEAATLRSTGQTARVSQLTTVGNINDYYYPDSAAIDTHYTQFTAYAGAGFGIKTVGGPLRLESDSGIRTHHDVYPGSNASNDLGRVNAVYRDCRLQNAPIVVSDERHKSNVRPIDDALLDAWGSLNFSMWQLNSAIAEKGEDDARWHFGLIAQQVKDTLVAHGLDWTKYGLITHESWDEKAAIPYKPAVIDDFGDIVIDEQMGEPHVPAGDMYMLRMEECFAVEAAYQRRRLERIESVINGLTS